MKNRNIDVFCTHDRTENRTWECPLSSQTRSVAAGANPLTEIAVRDKKINFINSLRARNMQCNRILIEKIKLDMFCNSPVSLHRVHRHGLNA